MSWILRGSHGWTCVQLLPISQFIQPTCGSGAPSLWSRRITIWFTLVTLAEMLYTLGVLNPRLSYKGWTKLEIFLGSRPTLLMMWLASILLMQLWWPGHTIGRWLRWVACWLTGPHKWTDSTFYLLLAVSIFPESGLQKTELIMDTFPITQGSKNRLFVRTMVMWSGARTEVHMGLFLVDCMVQRAI